MEIFAPTLGREGTFGIEGTADYRVVNSGGRYPGEFSGTRSRYVFNDWGYWAKTGDETLFRAFIRGGLENGASYTLHFEGNPSGTNPVTGAAVWSGRVRAFETHPDVFGTPVSGDARIEADFAALTLNVEFTSLTEGHGDMVWRDLSIVDGTFQHRDGFDTLDGAFYGDQHQGAAGSFERDRLRGIFGTLREKKP